MVTTRARTAARKPKSRSVDSMPKRRLFTVDEYYRMDEIGIFGPEERTELVEGEILLMAAMGDPHARTVDRLTARCVRRLPEDVIVRVQSHVRMSDYSHPQPDIAVLRWRDGEYGDAPPGPGDIFLLIEVSDTTLGYDLGRKRDVYAIAGVSEYWVFAIQGQQIVVLRKPEGGRYTEELRVGRGGSVSPITFPDFTLTADEIFG